MTDPEVVNGLQTSTEIFNYFSQHKDKLSDESRNLLVRVIVPNSEESRDRIILATNSQTSIPKSSLRATDSIHRQIEMFFKPRNLYYDRRKNYYKNQGKKAAQIVSVSFLAQCLMSTILQTPNYARARPSTLLTDDSAYKKLYVDNQNLNAFYAAAFIGKQVENVLKKSSPYSTAQKADILFYVIYMVVSKKVNQAKISSELLATLNDPHGVPRRAKLRGMSSKRFMGEVNGSDKSYSFSISARNQCGSLHLFESAIDLMSYSSLELLSGKDW